MNTTTSLRTPLLSPCMTSTPESASSSVAIRQGSTVTQVDAQAHMPASERPLPKPSLDDYRITKARIRKNILIGALIGLPFFVVGAAIGALIAKIRITRTPEQELKRQLDNTASHLKHLENQRNQLQKKVDLSWQEIRKTHAFRSPDELKARAEELRSQGETLSEEMFKNRAERRQVRNDMYTMEAPIHSAEHDLFNAEMRRDHLQDNYRRDFIDRLTGNNPVQRACDEVAQCQAALKQAQNRVHSSPEYKQLKNRKTELNTKISNNETERKSIGARLHPLAQHEFKMNRLARMQKSCADTVWKKSKHEMNYNEFVLKKNPA